MKRQNHPKRHALLALFTALTLVLSMTACGGSGKQAKMYENSAADSAPMTSPEFDMPEEEAVVEEAGGSALTENISQTTMPDNLNLKLIWYANVWMETLQFDQSIEDITAMVRNLGGFVERSSTSGGSDAQGNYIDKSAHLTVRVPADKLNGFIGDLENCGTITSQDLSSENISLEYADTEARKKALQTEYDRLLELMAQAENVDAVIAVEARLSEVRLQLDALSSQLRTYDNLVDYATVRLNLQEVRKISGANATTISERIKNGFSNSLYGIRIFFENLLVFLVANIPVFLILALVITIVIVLLKKLRRRKERKMEKPSDPPASNPPTAQ